MDCIWSRIEPQTQNLLVLKMALKAHVVGEELLGELVRYHVLLPTLKNENMSAGDVVQSVA